jgi:hypothetical protein
MIVKSRVKEEENSYNSYAMVDTEEVNLDMPIKYLKTKELIVVTIYYLYIFLLLLHFMNICQLESILYYQFFIKYYI